MRNFLDAGENPPYGPIVTYYLADASENELTLTFSDAEGNAIQTFSSKEAEGDDANKPLRAPANAGTNRFLWDMRYPAATKVPGDKTVSEDLSGPLAPPGGYQVTLSVGGHTETQQFNLVKDPRVTATQEDFDAQFGLLLKIRDKLSETHESVIKLRSVREQVEEWAKRAVDHPAEEAISTSAAALNDKLTAIEEDLIQTNFRGPRPPEPAGQAQRQARRPGRRGIERGLCAARPDAGGLR